MLFKGKVISTYVRCEKTPTEEVFEGEGYFKADKTHHVRSQRCQKEIDPKTLEVFLFGEWRLVSELETKYRLVDKSVADIVPCPHRGSCVDYLAAVQATRRGK